MESEIARGIFIPLIGTSLGSACVFFMKGRMSPVISRILTGFAAGVMTAASVWSLIIPALEYSVGLGRLSFLPIVLGFASGVVLLILLDRWIPQPTARADGAEEGERRSTILVISVALHNFPEGMAVGAVYAALMAGDPTLSVAGAMLLSIGIAVQNLPEGAIVSMPLRASGRSRLRAFLCGVASGIVEPIGAALTLAAVGFMLSALPYLLSFAAGAMIYVVFEELAPEMSGDRGRLGAITFTVGFLFMMTLDVALG